MEMKAQRFCNNCKCLSVTEKNQTSKKEEHLCNKYHKQVIHFHFHPLLPRLNKCLNHKWWMFWE